MCKRNIFGWRIGVLKIFVNSFICTQYLNWIILFCSYTYLLLLIVWATETKAVMWTVHRSLHFHEKCFGGFRMRRRTWLRIYKGLPWFFTFLLQKIKKNTASLGWSRSVLTEVLFQHLVPVRLQYNRHCLKLPSQNAIKSKFRWILCDNEMDLLESWF